VLAVADTFARLAANSAFVLSLSKDFAANSLPLSPCLVAGGAKFAIDRRSPRRLPKVCAHYRIFRRLADQSLTENRPPNVYQLWREVA
jgi:hypothetical protein